MPIGVNQFQILSPDQANPYQYGLSKAVEARYNAANAAAQEAKNPYVGRQSLADVLHQELLNKYLPQEKEAAIKHQNIVNQYLPEDYQTTFDNRRATSAHYREEDINSKYKRDNGLLEPDSLQMIKYALSMGKQKTEDQQNAIQQAQAQSNAQAQSMQPERQTMISAFSPSDPQQQMLQQVATRMGMNGNQNKFTPMEQNPVEPFGYAPSQQELHQAVAQRMQTQAPQPQMSPQEEMIPGTNIPVSVAREALIKHSLGIPTPTPPDKSLIDYRKQSIELAQKREKAAAFRALPQSAREADISVVAPMAGGYTSAARELMSGKTPEEIAASKGYDPNDRATWPVPAPPPSKPVVTQQQKANIARNAREAIQERITKNLGFYPQKVLGYSPQMVTDLIQGKNAKQAGKTLAAVFMNNEENALMARGMGVQAGLGLIKMMNTKSLNDLKVPPFLQSKELLDSFRNEVRLYNNIMIGNENNTLNQMYRLQDTINTPKEEMQASNKSSGSHADQIADLDRQIAEEEKRLAEGGQ
jgi:hypothetical protein